MPTGRMIGEYWKNFNQRADAGQVNPWVNGIAQFMPGPAIGNFYQNIQEGNTIATPVSFLSAFPTAGFAKFVKTPFGPHAINLYGKTAGGVVSNQLEGSLSDLLTNTQALSFGSGKGN